MNPNGSRFLMFWKRLLMNANNVLIVGQIDLFVYRLIDWPAACIFSDWKRVIASEFGHPTVLPTI